MEEAPFYRTDLAGQKVPVHFEEIHPVLRNVVHYFEINLNETMNVLVLAEYAELEYWKYLSIFWEGFEWAESKRYAWLCERGCLAMLNGLALDFLDDQAFEGTENWQTNRARAQSCLPYLHSYQPSEPELETGRQFLIASFTFIAEMDSSDLDEDGCPVFELGQQGAWFTKNIVGNYYSSTAKLDFG